MRMISQPSCLMPINVYGILILMPNGEAMFTLYRTEFCSVSKVALVPCDQELMFCSGAEIVPKRSQCEQKPYLSYQDTSYNILVIQCATLPFDLKRSFSNTRVRCNFCSYKSIQT